MSIPAILKQAMKLDKSDLQFVIQELRALSKAAPEPSAEKKLLAPGEHLEEKRIRSNGKVYTYVHLRWWERKGKSYVHRSTPIFKGTKAQYLAQRLGTDD